MNLIDIEKLISTNKNILSYSHYTNNIETVNMIINTGLIFKKFNYSTDLIKKRNVWENINNNRIFGQYMIIIHLERNVDILSLCDINKYDRFILPPKYIMGVVDIITGNIINV